MILSILFILAAVIFTTFLGYWFHRAFHQEWAGRFHRAHMNHHLVQYPANNFTSDEYRSAGTDNSVFLFALAFLPIMVIMVVGGLALGVSLWHIIFFIAGMLTTGFLHDRIHDAVHLNRTIWQYLPFYKKWQELHLIHHQNMLANFGIFSFALDKLFKTFR
jgi:sterol desaturase/sphingolipid hydroxylase (fatty acid hydroxylase superfamily)